MLLSFNRIISLCVLIGLGSLVIPRFAAAAELITDLELRSIPSWCQSAFRNSDYRDKIAPRPKTYDEVRPQQRKPSSSFQIPGGHHFCAGLVELNRAKRGKGSYKVAVSEINYSYSRMDPNYPSLSYVSAYLGRALYLSGNRQQAAEVWKGAMAAQPANRESYLAITEALLGEGQYERALDVMLAYDKAKEAEFADAEQFLAQVYFKLKQYEKALEHAEKAHQLGYPFTALRDTLQKIQGEK